MTTISNVQQIVSVIRAQLASRGAPAEGRVHQRDGAGGPASAAAPKDVAALIGQRIKAIDRDDPDRGRKTFRVFIESMLLSELGDELINDPQFYRIVDDVQRHMENDPQLQVSVSAAIEDLLKAA